MKLITKTLMHVAAMISLCAILFSATGCGNAPKKEELQKGLKYWVWMTADAERTDDSYTEEFQKYVSNGIDAVLIDTHTDADLLSRLTALATAEGLEVHSWIFTINRPGDAVAQEHPEWYQVSRDGKSCYDNPPYVPYYKWVCPTRPEVREHIYELVDKLAAVKGITSVQLDYIRYNDIFLPVGLLPNYDNLVQDTELPEYDFCYCDKCVEEFMKVHHRNPREMAHPENDIEWKQFRLNQVRRVVNECYKIVHKHGIKLAAAVFPYPEMADHMVRQRWDKWDIDMVLPMIYNNFYNEGTDWVGFATGQGVRDLEGKNVELHTGLFVPPLSPEELGEAIDLARDNGAAGIGFYDGPAITEEQFEVIRAHKNL